MEQPPLEGAYLILAGPGTGKTTLLTTRVRHVLTETKGARSRVLALTFTNRAAGEMRARLKAEPIDADNRSYIGTFHGFAAHVLRSHGNAIRVQSDFVIFDQSDQRSVLEDLQSEGILSEGLDLDSVIYSFSRLKSRGMLGDESDSPNDDASSGIREVHEKYRDRLERAGALDFGDLINECNRLFLERSPILDLYRTAYPYVLIDEFQDTTPAQFKLLNLLVNPTTRNVFAVADEDQLIFEWNEARLETINLFLDRFQAEMIYSTVSHRCPPVVVEAANAVIARNRLRVRSKPSIQTHLREQGAIYLHASEDVSDEALFVVDTTKWLHSQGHSLNEVGIIARTRRVLDPIEIALSEAGIAAAKPSTAGVGDEEEGQFVLRLLRWLQNPRDEQSVRRVVQFLAPSMSQSFEQAVRVGSTSGLPLEVALNEAARQGTASQWSDLLVAVTQWRLLNRDTAMLLRALEDGLPRFMEQSEKTIDVLTTLQELDRYRQEISSSQHLRLTDFLSGLPQVVASKPGPGSTSLNNGTVSLLTFHQAKGLEFSGVFLVGLEDGLFPDFRSDRNPRSLEEERRLFYVGLTRTKQYLFMSWARERPLWAVDP